MGVDVGNRLDARKRRGQGCVGSGMSVMSGIDLMRGRGKVEGASGRERVD